MAGTGGMGVAADCRCGRAILPLCVSENHVGHYSCSACGGKFVRSTLAVGDRVVVSHDAGEERGTVYGLTPVGFAMEYREPRRVDVHLDDDTFCAFPARRVRRVAA